MKTRLLNAKPDLSFDIESAVDLIASTQKANGEIPWCKDGKTDPWDHIESAMGLNIGGHRNAARPAFEWMAQLQRDDGSWYAAYRDGWCP